MSEPVIAEDGRYTCVIDGTPLAVTPEERVRQTFLCTLMDDYGYSPEVLRREVPIHHGSSALSDAEGNPIRADIVVYRTPAAAASRDQGQIKFVVECKRANEQEGHNQLVSYIFSTNAPGGVWTNGGDTTVFRVNRQSGSLETVPELPRFDEEWGVVDRRKKAELQRPHDIRRLFRLCHNKLYGRGMENSDYDLTMDMVRILLAKIQDESEITEYPAFYITETENGSAEGRACAAKRVRDLFDRFAQLNRSVFPDGERIEVPDAAIVAVVGVLQPWSLVVSQDAADDWDVMGAAYEQYTHQNLKRQRGQYFTNRLVVNMMVSITDPKDGDVILDPAGGSGGFTTAAFRYMRRAILAHTKENSPQRERALAAIRERVFLAEIAPRLVKLAKTAMLLNGDGHSGMTQGNSLGPYENLDDWLKARCGRHIPSLILTNPPFAGQGDSRIDDADIITAFPTARKFQMQGDCAVLTGDALPSQAPELLFFERALDWLKPSGRMAMVLPKSFLDTQAALPYRQLLFANARLDAVVTLHKNSFQPDTGVRTCVVFLTKYSDGEDTTADYEIFMATSQKVGQDSEGVPIYRTSEDGSPTLVLDQDLDAIADDFRASRSGQFNPSQFRYLVKRSDIENRLNINPQYYSPHLNESIAAAQRLGDRDSWSVTTLGQIASGVRIFKGPRLRTENVLVNGPAEGSEVVGYYTPSAMLQDKRDSAKWLDLGRASGRQLRNYDAVTVQQGDLLLTRSGTIGRLAYVTATMDGAIVSDDMIRVRVPSERERAYVAAFLLSNNAVSQMLRNEYGSIQQHLEPSHVSDLVVPIPDDWEDVAHIISRGRVYMAVREAADEAIQQLRNSGFDALLEG